ncbi:MAG TPA: serine/threonine-protein kinase [Polyangiaceae bacterium]|nr:serine/threonine-protein kinase [Polyangiaceae bacterium]
MAKREAQQSSLRPYRSIGRYRVYSELASGGMATVHLGCMLGPAGFSKLVAIKCLHAEFALENEFVSMFLDEARLTSSIHHPSVVATLDVVAEQGELLVVMEYIHGESLAVLLRTSRQTGDAPPLPVVTRIICDALDGLHAAHIASLAGRCLNIVHRDVSPQNIMVGADGNTRVLDFGIAQAAVRSHVTASGTVKGKLAYMSPEQLQAREVNARADIFAAGVVLWEALTGKRLFFSADARDTADRVLKSTIVPPTAIVPSLPGELDDVVLKALARDPEQRFDSAHEFAEALRRATTEGSRRAVSDWVNRVAKDSLARRLDLLETLEASAIHAQAQSVAPVITRSSPFHAPLPVDEGTVTRTTSTRAIAGEPERSPVARWGPFSAGIVGIVAVAIAWAMLPKPSTPPTLRTPAAQVFAALPVVDRPAAASSAPHASPLPVESLPLALPSTEPVKRAPSKPRSAATEVHPTRAQSCTPPYRIDAAGVRRVKLQCL